MVFLSMLFYHKYLNGTNMDLPFSVFPFTLSFMHDQKTEIIQVPNTIHDILEEIYLFPCLETLWSAKFSCCFQTLAYPPKFRDMRVNLNLSKVNIINMS